MEPTASSAADAHPLPERWSFWFDRFSSDATFEASIQELTSFASVEGFWRTYCHLARPTALGNGDNYHVFRGDRPPAWEAMPCLLYTSPSPRDRQKSRMPSSA